MIFKVLDALGLAIGVGQGMKMGQLLESQGELKKGRDHRYYVTIVLMLLLFHNCRINQLPVSATRWQHAVPYLSRNFYLVT
jgi:uracil-DNA glycosylase